MPVSAKRLASLTCPRCSTLYLRAAMNVSRLASYCTWPPRSSRALTGRPLTDEKLRPRSNQCFST